MEVERTEEMIWKHMNELILTTRQDHVFAARDLNGHIGNCDLEHERVHVNYGFEDKTEILKTTWILG